MLLYLKAFFGNVLLGGVRDPPCPQPALCEFCVLKKLAPAQTELCGLCPILMPGVVRWGHRVTFVDSYPMQRLALVRSFILITVNNDTCLHFSGGSVSEVCTSRTLLQHCICRQGFVSECGVYN